MAIDAPLEILSLIASHLVDGNEPLGPYALVNRSWQTAFETEIYRSLVVDSPSETTVIVVGRYPPLRKPGLTLERLNSITSGVRPWQVARRTYVRSLLYRVAVPHWLQDDLREKGENYTYDNPLRRENDAAFSTGIRLLFEHISSWTDPTRRISLGVGLRAEHVSTSDQATEPDAYVLEEDKNLIAAYLARLTPNCTLNRVDCVCSLHFPEMLAPAAMGTENRISSSAALAIASACGQTLRELELDCTDIPPDNEPGIRAQKRSSTAEALSQLPEGVDKLVINWGARYRGPDEEDDTGETFQERGDVDALSAALQRASTNLRELRVEGLEMSPDFFYPLQPAVLSGKSWERLQLLHLTAIPFNAPTNEHLRRCREGSIDPRAVVSHVRRPAYFNNEHPTLALIDSPFDAMYVSAGWAAQSMSNIKQLSITHGFGEQELHLKAVDGERYILSFDSLYGYSPSYDVVRAWRVSGELTLQGGKLEAMFESWPPK